ncbi:MAG TPA: hypothetical protein VE978_17035 [Chitinophagales bacterium]|nr:hypothetical protein [Chitinophagales bacterium]
MKKIWVLLMLITSVTAYAQKPLKPVTIKVITTHQKTVTGILYSISDSTISLSIDSKIKSEQSGAVNDKNAMAGTDSAAGCSTYSNHILITTFSFREIEKVKTPLLHAAILGIITGAVVGARAGRWVGTALDANNTESQESSMPLAVGFLALNGAIIGGLIMPHHETYLIHSDKQSFKEMIEQFRSKYSSN